MNVLVIGTQNSGKSTLAETVAMKTGDLRRYYLATMKVCDDAGRKRVQRHRKQRADKGFITLERERDIAGALEDMEDPGKCTVLLECISNLVGNEMHEGPERTEPAGSGPSEWERSADRIMDDIERLAGNVHNLIIVTNGYDEDGDEYDDDTRLYVKLLDMVNERLLAFADKVFDLRKG